MKPFTKNLIDIINHPGLSPTEKVILIKIFDHIDQEPISITQISKKTGLSKASVNRILAMLKRQSVIIWKSAKGKGRKQTNAYELRARRSWKLDYFGINDENSETDVEIILGIKENKY